MEKVTLGFRILLGLIFVVFGFNGILMQFGAQFMTPPPPATEAAGKFMGGLAGTGYFFFVLKITEFVAGLALLTGRFVPLALVVLAPIVLNIALYHFVLDPGGAIMSVFLLVALGWLGLKGYRDRFDSILSP